MSKIKEISGEIKLSDGPKPINLSQQGAAKIFRRHPSPFEEPSEVDKVFSEATKELKNSGYYKRLQIRKRMEESQKKKPAFSPEDLSHFFIEAEQQKLD
jgi:hypothetical protein